VGAIVAVEGLDGAGKATLVGALAEVAAARGATVAHRAFPRYHDDVHAELAGEALRGGLGDTADSVHAMALLFALDRRAAAADLRAEAHHHDLLLVDRYVASNAAYGAARRHERADGGFVTWVHDLEVRRFAVPAPDVQVLVRVPREVAAQRVRDRAASSGRTRDGYESDDELQSRCATVYDELVDAAWLAPWFVAETTPGTGDTLTRSAESVLDACLGRRSVADRR